MSGKTEISHAAARHRLNNVGYDRSDHTINQNDSNSKESCWVAMELALRAPVCNSWVLIGRDGYGKRARRRVEILAWR
eukprot:11206011-Lingulodinium_polyedra.AAC.1